MLTNGWTFALAAYRLDGTRLGQAAIDVDWEPARQWTRYVALCEGRLTGGDDGARVQPLWDRRGEPFLRGFRVVLRADLAERAVVCDFPKTFFRAYALALSSTYVESGALAPGDEFRYVPLAVHVEVPPAPRSRLALIVEDVSPALQAMPMAIASLGPETAAVGESLPGEVPVFVPEDVLAEVVRLTRAAGPVETGGALIGHLRRDPGLRQVFVEITAQIPARHTEASATRLLFTADTWRHLQQALDRRARGEAMVGWWHSHPVHAWCDGTTCAHRNSDTCGVLQDCFSEHDCAVHRAVFPGAHCVALVANVRSDADVKLSVYGWHAGLLLRRGLQGIAPRT